VSDLEGQHRGHKCRALQWHDTPAPPGALITKEEKL
jgi:hypothetical protein